MTCRHCSAVLTGKRLVCPDTCRRRKAPVNRCACGRVITALAKSCNRCQARRSYYRRKDRIARGLPAPQGRPKAPPESSEDIERKLAAIDAMKRRTRWMA